MFSKPPAPILLTNTLTGKKEELKTLKKGTATLYSCGPTVYGPIQIGNLRSFVLADLLARTLQGAGYKTKRVMNITDVGHLVGDGDEGADKMKVGAEREKTTPEAIADRYTALFKAHIEALNINTKDITFPRATQYIKEQIAMIRVLEKKGFTYSTTDGVYFDTSKFPAYGMLGNVRNMELQAGARIALGEKKNPHDFALWRAAKPHDLQQWDSPWGKGNPGWSIECSAMATTLLGPRIDIHTGGEDNAPIHHNNEIAQSESASGLHPFVRCWLHGAFLTMGGEKLSKSAGNSFTLDEVVERGIDPLALRYLYLQAHYRAPLSFSWESLEAAGEALSRLKRTTRALRAVTKKSKATKAQEQFAAYMRDDLATPSALAFLFDSLKNDTLSASEKLGLMETADAFLGLSLLTTEKPAPAELQQMANEREEARKNKDFAKADELRIHIEKRGYQVDDTPSGPVLSKINR